MLNFGASKSRVRGDPGLQGPLWIHTWNSNRCPPYFFTQFLVSFFVALEMLDYCLSFCYELSIVPEGFSVSYNDRM